MSKNYYYYRISKKLRNLTIGQLIRVCKKFDCPCCPLNKYCGCFENYLDRRVNLSIRYERKIESKK